jgi:hypothetical protein
MRIPTMAFIASVVTFALIGCRRDAHPDLDISEQLILYSIDGRDFEPGQEPKADEKFHGYPVLGKVEITDLGKRKEIIAALQEGLARSDGTIAKCFWPRHAMRTVSKGRTIDYIICFQCYQLEAHEGDIKSVRPITASPQPVFDKYLSEAGIPSIGTGRISEGK